jgi:hypothetical protein
LSRSGFIWHIRPKKQGLPGFAAKALVRNVPAFQLFKIMGFAFIGQKWSAVYMMNAMFLVRGRFEPFWCGQRWIHNWSREH